MKSNFNIIVDMTTLGIFILFLAIMSYFEL